MAKVQGEDVIDARKELKKDKVAQGLLRQFMRVDGPKGNNQQYDRGYEFNFRFTQEQRDEVNFLMENMGMSFAEAFDSYMEFLRLRAEEDTGND